MRLRKWELRGHLEHDMSWYHYFTREWGRMWKGQYEHVSLSGGATRSLFCCDKCVLWAKVAGTHLFLLHPTNPLVKSRPSGLQVFPWVQRFSIPGVVRQEEWRMTLISPPSMAWLKPGGHNWGLWSRGWQTVAVFGVAFSVSVNEVEQKQPCLSLYILSIYGCFHAIKTEFSSWEKDHMAWKAKIIYNLVLYRKYNC